MAAYLTFPNLNIIFFLVIFILGELFVFELFINSGAIFEGSIYWRTYLFFYLGWVTNEVYLFGIQISDKFIEELIVIRYFDVIEPIFIVLEIFLK